MRAHYRKIKHNEVLTVMLKSIDCFDPCGSWQSCTTSSLSVGGGKVKITATSHSLAEGDIICHDFVSERVDLSQWFSITFCLAPLSRLIFLMPPAHHYKATKTGYVKIF